MGREGDWGEMNVSSIGTTVHNMQELYLIGSIPSRRLDQVANTLTHLLGDPVPVLDFCMVFKPKDVPLTLPSMPESWLRLSADVKALDESDAEWSRKAQWKLRLEGASEPKRQNKCGIRPVNEAKFTDGPVLEFVQKMGYEFSHEYIVQGLEFTYDTCKVLMFQTLLPSQPHIIQPPFHPLNETWILQAKAIVLDATNQREMMVQSQRLTSLQSLLSSVCDLRNERL
ncbi:mediator complex subunit Pmc6 [Schizosaccharomyces japonicus yFS275]|uniref:Mediator of RNA polymerase II transcription subunit 18 n=1 Tax=Schizosaccharomyces japonicus (strain yFS275 / FY16936) TaxID=402676 RepID=B6K7U8_SCHJY|nr:mediator complex subunit Pmc6 [Schizosaccharomyces japonicus yFS275]EEB09602.2 mediator complex subunit Pmc6 [Schizosaccharomyces japonicus yFS275]